MKHYEFGLRFRTLFDLAVERYTAGRRSAGGLFTPDEAAWLGSNGIPAQHLYDYAEDQANYGEPGFEHALAIESVRRDYFLQVQGGKPSGTLLDETRLPAKIDAVRGIAWLPRLIPKARAKLRGELPPSLMFCCGGDRKFFQERNIFPAEFLSLVWRSGDNDAVIVDWVVKRSAASR